MAASSLSPIIEMKAIPRYSLTTPEQPTDPFADNFATLRLILKKPVTQRNSKSIQSLVSFVRHIKFFTEVKNQLSDEAVTQCCHYMTYEYLKKGQYVFKQGEQGAKFYVILEGECGVMVRGGEGEAVEVTVLKKGDSFGELGLLNNKGRAASILCKEDTHFAVLSKDDYERILLKIHQQKLAEKVDFLMALPFFGLCTNYAMQKLSYYFQEITVPRKHAIARCNDPVSSLYFVRDGEIQLIKDVKIQSLNTPLQLKSSKSLSCHVQVALLNKGECIGFEEAVYSKPHQYTALCYSTTARLLVISKEDFLKRINAEDALKHAEVLLEDKKLKYQNRINSMQMLYQNRVGDVKRPIATAEESDSLKSVGARLKKITVSDYQGCVTVPERKGGRELREQMRLYPDKGGIERARPGAKTERSAMKRERSWDVLLTKRLKPSSPPRFLTNLPFINIHTRSLKQQSLRCLTTFYESLSQASISIPHTTREDTGGYCITINSHETVTNFADETPPPVPQKLERMTRSTNGHFRLKSLREGSLF